jgi:8-hydroxy-5-deazaflavin:NADPH oxidoreductase
MKIAIIGTGNVGSALAKGFVKAGHEVMLGVRNKEEFKGSALLNVKKLPCIYLMKLPPQQK